MRTTAVLIALLAIVSYRNVRQQDPLALRSQGRRDAPVTMYEMSDFQCPYCREFTLTALPVVEQEYVRTGKVRLVFVNFPLTRIHPNAAAAARAAVCAARQHRFWPMHDLLFRQQDAWAKLPEPGPYFLALADSAGLDRRRLARCLPSPDVAGEVEADAQRAERTGATSTPTFYIEGSLLEGAAPAAVFRTVLDSIYQSKSAARPR